VLQQFCGANTALPPARIMLLLACCAWAVLTHGLVQPGRGAPGLSITSRGGSTGWSSKGDRRDLLLRASSAPLVPDRENVWVVRRGIIRGVVLPALESATKRLTRVEGDGAEEALLVLQQTAEERSESRKQRREKEAKNGVLLTTFFVAVGAAILRLGGRGALLNVLGLDFINQGEVASQVNAFVAYFQNTGSLSVILFFLGWVVAKVLCLDFIGVTLALSSGVLFGGVLQGTAVTVVSSSLASLLVFYVARTFLQEDIKPEIEKRPILRAVDRAVAKDGFKTVFVLRLSPLLPIPIGAYNYLYGGATSVRVADFVAGNSLASIKPYFLDSYLGVFGMSVVDGSSGTDGGMQDAILLLVVGVIIAVGTLATQVAGTVFDEIKQEAAAMGKADDLQLQSSKADVEGNRSSSSSSSSFVSKVFSFADGNQLPKWMVDIRNDFNNATARIETVVADEILSIAQESAVGINMAWNCTVQLQPNRTQLAIPISLESKQAQKIDHVLKDGVITYPYAYPGVRELAEFERLSSAGNDDITLDALYESIVFTFVLFKWAAAFLDDDTFVRIK